MARWEEPAAALDRGARRRTAEEGAPPVRPPAELGFAPPLLPASRLRVCRALALPCRATEREFGPALRGCRAGPLGSPRLGLALRGHFG
jgi:hypothetical protein